MEAVNILKWVLLKQSPSPPHPSDTLKAQVNGHQCRVPACRACGSVKTERPRKKKKKRESERRFYRKLLWTCADMLWRISTLRLRRPTQLEGKTENRTRCEKKNNKKNTVSHSSHAEATHGTHPESRMTCSTMIFACGYTNDAPLLKPVAVIINPNKLCLLVVKRHLYHRNTVYVLTQKQELLSESWPLHRSAFTPKHLTQPS